MLTRPSYLLPILLVLACACASEAENAIDHAVRLSIQTQVSPPKITVTWVPDADATGYAVSRKLPSAASWETGTALPSTATSYVDATVTSGVEYEYQVVKSATAYSGYGCISAGIDVPLIENRGKLILLVDNTQSVALAASLAQLEQDLVGDGWIVLRHDVSPADTVAEMKALILADYNSDPVNVNTLYLFGHIPVPYSGDFAPDGHPDHIGAWPDDSYYGDFTGTYTDSTVSESTSADVRNYNVPGDGKFDQSTIQGTVQLQIGRVDLADLSDFTQTETQLLQQYLDKAHTFRNKGWTIAQTGLIDDQFDMTTGEPFAADAWSNFAALVGPANTVDDTSVPTGLYNVLQTQSTLWVYGCGGGSYTNAGSVVYTNTFAGETILAVFSGLFGSYFGDWDSPNDLLRSSLANNGYGLAAIWAGRPFWYFHHMGQGHPLGYAARLTQNNSGLYPTGLFPRGVQIALMGDPTLRLQPVAPPTALTATRSGAAVQLTWTAPTDAVSGYYVYRARSFAGPFTRITNSLVTGLTYADSPAPPGAVYEVRAVLLQQGNSGTYWNASQGVFQVDLSNWPLVATPPSATAPPGTKFDIAWPAAITGVVFESTTSLSSGAWSTVSGTVVTEGTNSVYHYPGATGETTRYFRVRAGP